jgi:bifunctional lysine-specific demethylase and histidyl-hydroxylase NO66
MSSENDPLARCVGDVDSFGRRHWGLAPLHRRGGGSYDDLLTVDDVERLLATLARRPSFRLVRDGETLPVADYTKSVRVGATTVDDAADLDRIAEHLRDGVTVVLQGLHHTWPPLSRFCEDLEAAISHPVQANAYLSPANAAGLGRHHDLHDVFALQCAGTKTWDVGGLGLTVLEPGDTLYLPSGTQHSATAQRTFSLHITIGVLKVTYRQVLRRVIDRLDDLCDGPLPLGYARSGGLDELVDTVRDLLADTQRSLGEVDAADVVAREVARAERKPPRTMIGGALRVVLDPTAVHDDVRLRRRSGLGLRVAPDGGDLVVEFADRRLRMPGHTGAALEVILGQDEFLVAELAGLDRSSRSVLARRLVREGLLQIVTPITEQPS